LIELLVVIAIPSGTNVILTWSTNAVGFCVQSTTNLSSPFWSTNFPAPDGFTGLSRCMN
jgi:hypothetical protein